MALISVILSIFATIVSVLVTLRDKWAERFNQETTVVAVPFEYSIPASGSFLVLDAITTNHSSTPFAITGAHLWIETRPMITMDIDQPERLPEQDFYGIVPSFVMWSERTGNQTTQQETTGLPVVIPARSAVHYRIAFATPNTFLWPEFSDDITMVLETSIRGKTINISGQTIRPKLQKLETYMKEPRQTLPTDNPDKK